MSEEKTSVRTPIVRIGIYSLAVNLILVAAKLSLSFVTESLALRAGAIPLWVFLWVVYYEPEESRS